MSSMMKPEGDGFNRRDHIPVKVLSVLLYIERLHSGSIG